MDLAEFRDTVYATFGSRLERATPELMLDFICRAYAQLSPPTKNGGTLVIPTAGADSYEQIVHDFLARMLDSPPEQAVILLWLFAGEMYFTDLGEQYRERFKDLVPPWKKEE